MKYQVRVDTSSQRIQVLQYLDTHCQKIEQGLYLINSEDLFNIAYIAAVDQIRLSHDKNTNQYYIYTEYFDGDDQQDW